MGVKLIVTGQSVEGVDHFSLDLGVDRYLRRRRRKRKRRKRRRRMKRTNDGKNESRMMMMITARITTASLYIKSSNLQTVQLES